MPINEKYNYDDVFMRDVTVSLLATLDDRIKWTNVFSSGPQDVNCKIYYSMTGKDDFLMDSFVDDIASNNRKVELNTDSYPSGWITLSGWNIRSDEFANPNVWLRSVVENQEEIKGIIAKIRAVPVTLNYELTILLNSEIDTFKASQRIMDMLWAYEYFYLEYNFMNIDAVVKIPDDQSIEINRDVSLDSTDTPIKMTLNLEVQTYYPAYNDDTISTMPYGSEWFNQLKYIRTGLSPETYKQTDFEFTLDKTRYSFDNDEFVKADVMLYSSTTIEVTIYDAYARIKDEIIFDEEYTGKNLINIDIRDKEKYKTGIYYVKIKTKSSDLTERFEIA